MKILLLVTHPHVIPNNFIQRKMMAVSQYAFLSVLVFLWNVISRRPSTVPIQSSHLSKYSSNPRMCPCFLGGKSCFGPDWLYCMDKNNYKKKALVFICHLDSCTIMAVIFKYTSIITVKHICFSNIGTKVYKPQHSEQALISKVWIYHFS